METKSHKTAAMLLPNVVLFPYTQIPLLIFEPRYRQMVEDCFRGNRSFAVFYLPPHRSEEESCAIGCLGEIVGYQKLSNGFYQLVLRGEKRIERIGWDRSRPYPYLVYRELKDIPFQNKKEQRERKIAILKLAKAYLGLVQDSQQSVEKMMEIALQLGCEEIIHWACLLIHFETSHKQKILEEPSLVHRAGAIQKVLEEKMSEQHFIQKMSPLRPEDPRVN